MGWVHTVNCSKTTHSFGDTELPIDECAVAIKTQQANICKLHVYFVSRAVGLFRQLAHTPIASNR